MMLRVRPAQLTTTSVSGVGRELMHPIHQFGSRRGHAAGDVHTVIFLVRPRIEDEEFSAAVDQAFDFLRRHPRRIVMMLDEFAEGLGGTFTPENTSPPAAFQPAQPPSSSAMSL